jgi:hypothetical protein
VIIVCPQCQQKAEKASGAVNRSKRAGMTVYCGRGCAGLARRINKSKEQKIAEKAVYDAEYRSKNKDILKAKKATYYAQNHDREKERAYRTKRMPAHVQYCRRAEYRQWKADYDKRYLARKQYGDFADAAILLREVEDEVLSRASRYEIDLASGKLGKTQRRKREYVKAIGC